MTLNNIEKLTGNEIVTEVLNIVAGFTGFEREWFEHIVATRWAGGAGCNCRTRDGEREVECQRWLAIKRVKDAEQSLERAKSELGRAQANLDGLSQ